jgi:tripartite motif-containing protein 71
MKFVKFLFLIVLFALYFLIFPETALSEGGYQFVTKWGTDRFGDGQLHAPRSIAVDSSGNVYVSDYGNNRIQKYTSAGVFITKWGSPGSGDGQFNKPLGITVDAAGNVYVADIVNNRIQKFSSSGVFITKWGSLGSGDGQFNYPYGVAVDTSGNVYVSDSNNRRVQKFSSSGAFIAKWGSPGSGDGQFTSPSGVAVDASGNVYVIDSYGRIQKFSSSGVFIMKWGSPGSGDGHFMNANDLAVDAEGYVYVVDFSALHGRVQKFTASGTFVTKWGSLGSWDGQFTSPSGIDIDAVGNVYVADYSNNCVQRFSSTGFFLTKWGAPSGDGQLFSPKGIAVEASGNVYVADTGNNRIQKFSATGAFITKWGSPGSGDGQFNYPSGIAVDALGNVYVADYVDNRIQKFTPSGSFIMKWGSQGSGDGQFSSPCGVAVDALGNVYVADQMNYRIQKFSSSGAFIAKWGSQGTGKGQLNYPYGVAVDTLGYVYVTDQYSRLQKFTSSGGFIAKWSMASASGIALDASGNVFMTDLTYNTLKSSPSGGLIARWGSKGSGDGQFDILSGIAVDSAGNVYVADSENWNVQKFSPTAPAASITRLVFPHVDTSPPWQTEVAVINAGDEIFTGTLRGLNNKGDLIESKVITFLPHIRRQYTVADSFTNPTDIGYIVVDAESDAVQGYAKLYQTGGFRAAVAAVKDATAEEIPVPHVDSSALWWTGIGLVNTTAARKDLVITFNTGQSVPYTLDAFEHRAFMIESLFDNQPQPAIRSAVIGNAVGVIGLALFGSRGGGSQLDGVPLSGITATTLIYPHVAGAGWWTGIVAYNPSESACSITLTPYSAQGNPLSPLTQPLAGKGKFIGMAEDLGLPVGTAWFKIEAPQPLAGFALFGTADGKQLAAYAPTGGTGAKAGIFPKLEKGGWTGIAFVNTEAGAASVTLTAYNDAGAVVATQQLSVGGYAKVVNMAESIFTQNIGTANYIAYSSDKNVVGFQLNGSADGTMLDGLPAL